MDHFPFPTGIMQKLRSYNVLDLKCEKQNYLAFLLPPSVFFYGGDPVSCIIYFIPPSPPFLSLHTSSGSVVCDRLWRTLSYTRADAPTFVRRSLNRPRRTSQFDPRRKFLSARLLKKKLMIITEVVNRRETRHWYVNLANVKALNVRPAWKIEENTAVIFSGNYSLGGTRRF